MQFSWSYSAYSSAVSCLRKYKLCYIDKILPAGAESSDLVFGSALHSAINAVLSREDGVATFEMYWESYRGKGLEYGRFNWEQLAGIGAEFVRKFIKLHSKKYRLQFAEKRLFGEYKGIKLEGTPDFYGEYNGRMSLRDFKTSGRNYEPEKALCALQLNLYAYLYMKSFPTAKIDTLGYTVFNKAIGSIQDLTWDFREEDMYESLDNMVEYCEIVDLEAADWGTYPKNFNSCLNYNRRCEYFSLCHKENKE